MHTSFSLSPPVRPPCRKHVRELVRRPFRPTATVDLLLVRPPSVLSCLSVSHSLRWKMNGERHDFFFQRLYPPACHARPRPCPPMSMSTRSDGRVGVLTILAGLHELPDETDELARLLGRAKHPLIFSPSLVASRSQRTK